MNSDLIKLEPAPIGRTQEVVEVGSPIDLRQVLQVLLERFWIVLLVSLLAGAAALQYARQSPSKYVAKTVLQVEQEEQRLISIEEVSRQDLRAAEVLNTIVQNLKNTSVMLRVVKRHHLNASPVFRPSATNEISEAQAARMLAGMVNARLRPETRLIDVAVSHSQPEMARLLADSVAEEFIRQYQEQRFGATRAANELLYAEAVKLKGKLEAAERRLQDYKESHNTVPMEDRQNITVAKLQALNERCMEAKTERLRLEADLRQMEALAGQPEALLGLTRVTEDPAVSELRRRIAAQQAEVASLAQRYKAKHPKLIQAEQQIADLRASLNSIVLAAPGTLKASYEAAVAREKNVAAALAAVQQEVLELDRKSIEYNVLVHEVQSERALYDSVLKRLKETDFSKGLDNSSISIVEPAERPAVAIKTPATLVGAVGFLGTFFAMLGLFYLLRVTNKSIRTVDEAEQVLGLPVWGAIPATRRKRKRLTQVVVEEPASVCSESFRTLRTSAGLVSRETSKIHLFTSADPGEGKSFCSLNYAVCQAQEGRRTLLIDLDLRKPSLGAGLSLPADTPGVSDYLSGRYSLAELVQPGSHPNLFVLPAGPLLTNPAEVLANGALHQLLLEAIAQYDRVVLDTAPILAVSDTLLILAHADTVCLVVRSGKTSRRAVSRAMELMARANVPPAGIVLNFLPQRRGPGYYYHYGQNGGYGHKGVYGTERKALAASSSL